MLDGNSSDECDRTNSGVHEGQALEPVLAKAIFVFSCYAHPGKAIHRSDGTRFGNLRVERDFIETGYRTVSASSIDEADHSFFAQSRISVDDSRTAVCRNSITR